jgi:PKD repeat protein
LYACRIKIMVLFYNLFIRKIQFVFFFSLLFFSVGAQECGYVYVSPAGASSGSAGTKLNPASFTYGLTLATPPNNIIRMASGNYNISNTVNVPSGLIIEGGYNASTWVKSNTTPTVIKRDSLNILNNPNRLIAFNCVNVSGFRLLDLTINTDNATGNGVSVYAIYLNGCSDYVISRCIVNAGKGSAGLPGNSGTPGMNGASGQDGEDGQEVGNCCRNGGAGAGGSFTGSNPGGNGGMGAERGGFNVDTNCTFGCYYYNVPGSDYTNDGFNGDPGLGLGGSAGGKGGMGVCQAQYQQGNCSAQLTNHGKNGDPGVDGPAGQNGLQGSDSYAGGYYVPGTGTTGTVGVNAGGGGGGGGGGAKGCEPAVLKPSNGDTLSYNSGSGAGGGGGGEGGQGGQPGTGGSGAGGSFAVFTWANGINGFIRDCVLNPGQGGLGGSGGPGGMGGNGGAGGLGGNTGLNGCCNSCNTGEGGNGGPGGKGGKGGDGGKGSDGASKAIYQEQGGEPILITNSYNPFAPAVTVSYSGCANSDIIFTTNATGNIDWIFGLGATPQTSTKNTDTVHYDNSFPGFRSITLVVDGVPYTFANFIYINQTFTPPVITSSAKVICVGSSVGFSTTATADTYGWSFPGGSISSSSVQNPGNVTFNSAGTYVVTLTTTTCCGTSVARDTISVVTGPTVNLGPDTSFCFTDTPPVLNAGNPGATYAWTINGNPAGSSQTLQATGSGVYAVTVNYGTCTQSDSKNISVYTTLPVNLGADTSICANAAFPVINANMPNMANYQWYLDNNPVGTNSQTLQTSIAGTYTVSITSPTGCKGSDSKVVSVSDPKVNLGGNKTICSNESKPVLNAGNSGSTYSWKLNGSSIGGNTQTHQTVAAGTYSVSITNQFGCNATDSMTLSIIPALNAQITAVTSTTVGTPVSFTDMTTPAANSWIWNFGDGSPNVTIQYPTYTYNTAGTYSVFLIASNANCSDTAIVTITVLNNCNTLGLTSSFTSSADTVYLSVSGLVSFTSTSSNATAYLWNFGDGATSTLQNPNHVYISPGTNKTIVVKESTLSAEELKQDFNFRIYPNPASNSIIVEFSEYEYSEINIEILNMIGQKVFYYSSLYQSGNKKEINISSFSKGVYFVKAGNQFNETIQKLIIE